MDVKTVVKGSPVVFSLALLAVVALLFVSEGTYWQSIVSLEQLLIAAQGRQGVRELDIGLLEAESAQRGYLLTQRKEYLQTYESGLKLANESLTLLEQRHAGNAALAPQLEALRSALHSKLAEMSTALSLHDQGRIDAAIAPVLSAQGKDQMAIVRGIGAALLDGEAQIIAAGRAEQFKTLKLGRIETIVLCFSGLLALYFYLRHNAILGAHALELKRVAQVESSRLESEVRQRTAQLTELTLHLQTAREEERGRLARNLHDELGALLTAAKLDAARIKARLGDTAPEAHAPLAHLVTALNGAIALGRSIIENLRPSTLANLGLVTTLEILLREFGENSGVKVHEALAPVLLRPATELVIYRLVQEATTNIAKYAKASQVWIEMASLDGQVQVSVRDDGVGFDSDTKPSSAYGLTGMRFRVEAEGGRMRVMSKLGHGTHILVTLPEAATGAPHGVADA